MALLAAWLFDELTGTTAAEWSGNTTLDMTTSTSGILTTNGLDLSGGNYYSSISYANAAALRIQPPFSICVGFDLNSPTTTNFQIHNNNYASTYCGWNVVTDSSGQLEFMYGNNTGNGASTRRSTFVTTPLSTGYIDAAITVTDTSGNSTPAGIYIDGVAQTVGTSGTGGAMVYQSTGEFNLGFWSVWNYYTNGIIRYLYIYDHILTLDEIQAIDSNYFDGLPFKYVTINLRKRDGAPQKNLTGIKWAWFDQTDPNSFIAPTDSGNIEVIDSSGNIKINLPTTSLNVGQFGCLALMSSDNVYTGIYRLEVKQ